MKDKNRFTELMISFAIIALGIAILPKAINWLSDELFFNELSKNEKK